MLVLIDDATSEIFGLHFVENECLQGYFDLIRDYIERCGRPLSIYSDRHSIFHIGGSLFPQPAELGHIFSIQAQRRLSINLELSYKNVIYQIQTKAPGYSMRGAAVTVCERPGEVILLYKGKPQPYQTFDKNNRPKEAVASKDLNRYLDTNKMRRTPKPNHPWRTYPEGQVLSKKNTYPQPSQSSLTSCRSSAL